MIVYIVTDHYITGGLNNQVSTRSNFYRDWISLYTGTPLIVSVAQGPYDLCTT